MQNFCSSQITWHCLSLSMDLSRGPKASIGIEPCPMIDCTKYRRVLTANLISSNWTSSWSSAGWRTTSKSTFGLRCTSRHVALRCLVSLELSCEGWQLVEAQNGPEGEGATGPAMPNKGPEGGLVQIVHHNNDESTILTKGTEERMCWTRCVFQVTFFRLCVAGWGCVSARAPSIDCLCCFCFLLLPLLLPRGRLDRRIDGHMGWMGWECCEPRSRRAAELDETAKHQTGGDNLQLRVYESSSPNDSPERLFRRVTTVSPTGSGIHTKTRAHGKRWRTDQLTIE